MEPRLVDLRRGSHGPVHPRYRGPLCGPPHLAHRRRRHRTRGAPQADSDSGPHGRALLQLEEWRDRAIGAADSAVVTSTGGRSSDWSRHELKIRVPANSDAHSSFLAAAVQGTGTAWFAPLELLLDGRPITAIPSQVPPLSAAEHHALAARSTPLGPVDAEGRAEPDLDRVAAIVGTARVVGLGESTHGTSEFFRVKHRLLKHLVNELGFSVFAIEANQLAVERVNRYVQGGPGTAADVMRVMFRVWNTEEMLALIEWLRSYNAARPRRVVPARPQPTTTASS